MQKLQTQGLHHITLVGADRETSIDFWEGLLGMPSFSSSPISTMLARATSISIPATGCPSHLHPEDRKPVKRRTPTETGCVHHIAFNVSRAVFMQIVDRLAARASPTLGCATE